MTSETDYNAQVSGAKIEPLDSETKRHVPHDDHGKIGEDADIEHTHLQPLDSPVKEHHHHEWPQADSQGVIGREDVVQGSKIPPLEGKTKQATQHTQGLDDETLSKPHIPPMGGFRDDVEGRQ